MPSRSFLGGSATLFHKNSEQMEFPNWSPKRHSSNAFCQGFAEGVFDIERMKFKPTKLTRCWFLWTSKWLVNGTYPIVCAGCQSYESHDLAIWPWRFATERDFSFAPNGFVFDGELHGVQRPMLYTRKAILVQWPSAFGARRCQKQMPYFFDFTAPSLESHSWWFVPIDFEHIQLKTYNVIFQ